MTSNEVEAARERDRKAALEEAFRARKRRWADDMYELLKCCPGFLDKAGGAEARFTAAEIRIVLARIREAP